MASKSFLILIFLSSFWGSFTAHNLKNLNSNSSFELPYHFSFNADSASIGSHCSLTEPNRIAIIDTTREADHLDQDDGDVMVFTKPSIKLNLKHTGTKQFVLGSIAGDLTRVLTLHRRITAKTNPNAISGRQRKPEAAPAAPPATSADGFSGQFTASLSSGANLGSGEYLVDMFMGTPPRQFSLIMDTGSDLSWVQCTPCYDCFDQSEPHYSPQDSTSFQNILCHDPRCELVSSPDPPHPCKGVNQTCPYLYHYADSSNTTGDFALETFTINLTKPAGPSHFRAVENIMFGCGHWNRGYIQGAAGMLGLGRGPLSFSSQLQSIYGHSFSYCLAELYGNRGGRGKLIFGEDRRLLSHPELNFTSFVTGLENQDQTFYYVEIKSIVLDGAVLDIPEGTWQVSPDGTGGTIIDSGTTLSCFVDPAYSIIKEAFLRKVRAYPVVEDYSILEPCYNLSGVEEPEMPTFGIVFGDGAVWNFPVDNYFIRLGSGEVGCLAILGIPSSTMSIIGNYQQQNFHVMYDTNKSRLGFAPARCASI